MTAFALIEDVAKVMREYYQLVTRDEDVDHSLRAMYLQKQVDGPVGDHYGWRTRAGLRVKQPQNLNIQPPTNFRKLGDGDTFELA